MFVKRKGAPWDRTTDNNDIDEFYLVIINSSKRKLRCYTAVWSLLAAPPSK